MGRDSVKGRLDGLLSALEAGPRHGYAIIEALQRATGGAPDLPTGTVYPASRRLERAGLLRGTWTEVGGRRRRTYALTAAGHRALSSRRGDWIRFSGAIS